MAASTSEKGTWLNYTIQTFARRFFDATLFVQLLTQNIGTSFSV